jgi:hypothetical protein
MMAVNDLQYVGGLCQLAIVAKQAENTELATAINEEALRYFTENVFVSVAKVVKFEN